MNIYRLLGIVCQSVVLGTLLFIALMKLIALSTGTRVFLYQGF